MAVLLAALGLLGVAGPAANAAVAPIIQPPASTVTADRLPTVQIDGVVWSQAVVGNTVYAGGKFANARPAGAAAGTSLTPRANLMAYDITTGNLVTSFAPSLNGQVLSVTASPDGSRVYVVGDFTTANGQARRRVAAYSTANGALITTFNPAGVSSQARAVIATNDTVYVGGGFGTVGTGQTRRNLVAFRASDGALLPWNPTADSTVWALAISNDGSSVIAGGTFQNVGGSPAYGLAKINGGSGVLDPTWAPEVRNAGKDAGITSLRVQGAFVYGTTFHFGPGGNLEGTFKVPVSSGVAEWVTDCHGDNYSTFMANGVVYSASHAHYCGNMGGGFPQYSTWKFQHAQAWSDTVTGDILNDVHGYPNWHGVKQGPALVHWNPDMGIGSYTGQYQAGWSVTGNNDYVVFGGEFPTVNSVGQQGLVRFGKRPAAPAKEGPRFVGNAIVPTLTPVSTTAVRVSWPAGFDRDSYTLTYKALRTGVTAPRFTQTANSNWWTLPQQGFVDTGLTPGTTYTYRIAVNDPDGNTVTGATTSVTMPTAFAAATSYASSVRNLGARIYWPLNETSGTTVTDRAAGPTTVPGVGVTDGRADTGVTWGQPGAVAGDGAASLGDNDYSRVFAGNCASTVGCQWGAETAPDTFTSQVWIKTGTTRGGRILGFGDLQNGSSGHRDRNLYLDDGGRLVFGVKAQDGSARTVSSARSYNDDQWHMVSATMSAAGMALYVDGVRVGRRGDTTQGEAYVGYWRLGGDNLDGWPSRPSTNNFIGSVDEVAIYPTALDQNQIIAQYEASGRPSVIPTAPADALGAAVYADEPDLFWRLAESSGTKALDSGRSLSDGTYRNSPTLGQTGVVAGNTAARFDGNNQFVASDGQVSNPTVFSEEAWFKTTTNRGGKIIGFGNNPTDLSGAYDRHVYMQDDGRLVFGTYTGQLNTITSPGALNDGQWHHVVASQSGNGMKLFVDGVASGTNPQTAAQAYDGYWKVGGDNTWGSSSAYFDGIIDEVAVYSYELAQPRVQAHFLAGGGVLNQPPTAAFTSTTSQRRATFDAGGSADPDGTIVSYAWDFGDSTTGAGRNLVHVFGAAGSYAVKLKVTDNKGDTGISTQLVTVTAPTVPADKYGAAVVSDSPRLYWRLNDSGTKAVDISGGQSDGSYFNGYTQGVAGALPGSDTAVRFDGNGGLLSSDEAFENPTTYSEEAWFKTGSTRGGKIIGFGNTRTGGSSSYDRHVYLQDDGHLVFGTYTGQLNTITTPASYNNDQWHHVVATQSSNGMRLYVDGELTGTNPQTQAEGYTGYWKVGGDNTWGSSSAYLDGTIDEVAVYLTELSATRVAAHYAAAAPEPNVKPTARVTTTKTDLTVTADGTTSTDPDGTIAAYSWNFGDTFTTDGATVNHTYAAAGTYTITLTVTDDDGETDTKTASVTVQAANIAPTAAYAGSVDHLSVNLNAADSDDPDGTLEDYAWDFGDGSTGSGETVSHTYATPGDKIVTLTVTDNRGGTDTETKTVTVTRPPNTAPTAAFNSSVTNLQVSLNAAGSADADGTVVSYGWDFGDGSSAGSGVSTSHTYQAAGTYTVTLTVTDNDGATATASQPVTVTPANVSPVAAFAIAKTNLKVDVDAAESSDSDGSIASYAWTYGDGASGFGRTDGHTYASAGTYPITLVVTDDDGATTSLAKDVTVAAPVNRAPTAAFTATTANLVASLNGTGSTDPDGTVVGYSWSFGDNTSGTGSTTSHPYAAAGTYQVTLTVTDNQGATNAKTTPVTVTAPAVTAVDNFERTSTNSWGNAQTGGAWTIGGTTSNYQVLNGVGTMKMAVGAGPSAYLNGVSATNVDLTTTFKFDKAGTGGGVYTSLVGRRVGTSDYRVKVKVSATDAVIYLVRTVNGTETILSSQTVAGMSVAANETVNLRLQLQGSGTTTLRTKIWKTGAEPAAWRLTSTDTTAALQRPGGVGIFNYLSGSATNAPVTSSVLDFRVVPV